MKKSNEQSLADAIREMLNAYRMNNKLDEVKIIQGWDQVVGEMISKHTQNLYIKNRTLFVKVDSPALKNELSYSKEKLVELLNDSAGNEVIDKIVLT